MDAVETLHRELVDDAKYITRRRVNAGPVVSSDEFPAPGVSVGYGVNSRGEQFAALFKDGQRKTNWMRI